MPVTLLLDHLGSHLEGQLGASATIGVARPASLNELPMITLSLPVVEPTMPSVGRRSEPPLVGAIRVERSLDLADPALDFGAERVSLLSSDRLTLQMPHGPIVRADGVGQTPFTVADLTIRLGATTFTPVTTAPGANQCRPDPATGIVTFAAPLATVGTLQLGYFIGQWEVRSERYAGALQVDSFALTAQAVEDLSNQVFEALHEPVGVSGLRRLAATAVGSINLAEIESARDAQARTFTFRFDFEAIEVILPTGGGPIGRIAVDSEMVIRETEPGVLEVDPDSHEAFNILKKGSVQ